MTALELRGLSRGGALLLALSLLRLGWEQLRRPADLLEGGSSEAAALLEGNRLAASRERERNRALAPGERVDPNRAGEEEIDRLPGVGPGTARALVQNREEEGGFTRPEDLLRVSGIGPGTLEKIRPHLDFSRGLPPELSRVRGGGRRAGGEGSVPLAGPFSPGAAGEPSPDRVNVNRATLEELQALPGIGPALAGRIVESRQGEGPFRVPEDLLRVTGIGPATLARIRDRISLER